MVGAATNTTSIATMTQILGKRATVINLISLILISLFFGMIVDLFSISIPNLDHIHIHEHTHILIIYQHLLSLDLQRIHF